MNDISTRQIRSVYVTAALYLITMLPGFVLILQTDFPQIGFDADLASIARAYDAARPAVIISHLLLAAGFFLFFPLGRFISDSVGLRGSALTTGLLNASLVLRMLPWLGALPLYLLLSTQANTGLTSDPLAWNGLFQLLNSLGEDVAVNLLTGSWTIVVSVMLWRHAANVPHRAAAGLGLVLGVLFIAAAGDLVGVDLIQAGSPIATLISPLLHLWPVATAVVLARQAANHSPA